MLPGPLEFRRCYFCANKITKQTYESGNLFNAVYFTDGKLDAPMYPVNELLVKCPHCKSLAWWYELEYIGEAFYWLKGDSKFSGGKPYDLPGFREYFSFLKKNQCSQEEKIYIRLKIWWKGNDRRRYSGKQIPLSRYEIANMKALFNLLDDQDAEDLLLKAEIMREMGNFEKAGELLNQVSDPELKHIVDFMVELIRQKDIYVKKLEIEE